MRKATKGQSEQRRQREIRRRTQRRARWQRALLWGGAFVACVLGLSLAGSLRRSMAEGWSFMAAPDVAALRAVPDALSPEEVEAKIDERLEQMSQRREQRNHDKQERMRMGGVAQRAMQRSIPREPPPPPPIPDEAQGLDAAGVLE